MNIAIMSEDEGADRPRHVADAVSRQRSDDHDSGLLDGKKVCGKTSEAAVALMKKS